MCTGPAWVVLRALTPLNHAFFAATNTKIDALATAHDLAREHQRKNGGGIQYGETTHAIPPDSTMRDCEYVAVGDEAMWVVVQA